MTEPPPPPALPTSPTPPPSPPSAGEAGGNPIAASALRPVTVPLLVSAIANLLAGYLWFLSSCFGFLVAAPLLVLATFELWTVAGAARLAPRELTRRVTVLGVCELLAGVFNLVSLVCGTVALLNVGKIEKRPGSTPHSTTESPAESRIAGGPAASADRSD